MIRRLLIIFGLLATGGGMVRGQGGLKEIPDTGIEAALEGFKLPEGAKIEVFAADPQISKPIQMNWDKQGRLWVVGSSMYPQIKPGQKEGDQLFVLEDTTGDGHADKVGLFADGLHIPTAVAPGDGGVYVANSIEVLFLKDTDGDGKADFREVVLSGFGTEDTHHLLHTFQFGPEGMLWFNQSIYIHSHVETPWGVRRLLGGGIWHYRTETGRLEVYSKGLVNPWGHAFDYWGQDFATDGAGGEGINYLFPRSVFKTSPGAQRALTGMSPGQPKHCGLEVVSGRHVPEQWVGTMLAPDFRGHRVNRFALAESGSNYAATQQEDLVASKHRAFRPIDVKMGPDGAVYIADWYNPIIQHGEVDWRDSRRDHSHGRIWRVTFEGRKLVEKPEIVGQPVEKLLAMLSAPEQWTRHFVKQELRDRGREAVMPALEKWVAGLDGDDDHALLEAVWTAQGLNVLREDWVKRLLASQDHHARAAGLRALYYRAAEIGDSVEVASGLIGDKNQQVRLWAVSVLAQTPSLKAVQSAMKAVDLEKDDALDFALWSIAREHRSQWLPLAKNGKNPFAGESQLLFAAKATGEAVAVDEILTTLEKGGFKADQVKDVGDWLAKVGDAEVLARMFARAQQGQVVLEEKRILLQALMDAAKLRKLHPAGGVEQVNSHLAGDDAATFAVAASLAGLWKVEASRPVLEEAFLAADKDEGRARAAMEGLRYLGGGKTVQIFQETALDKGLSYRLRSLGVIGRTQMAANAGAELAVGVLKDSPDGKDGYGIYAAFLASKQGPGALAAALREKNVKLPQAIALVGVQQASGAATKPEGLIKALQDAAGLKPMKTALTLEEMGAVMARVAKEGDPHQGEAVYRRAALQCAVCHAIGGAGGVIGPDLLSIGSSAPVDYLIESLLEPSKKIKEGYHTTLVTTKGGQAFAGAIAGESPDELVVRDGAGKENRISKSDIASNAVSPVSLMPPGLTASLREDEFINLVRFLSELGKEGEFKVSAKRHVRHWEALMPHERTRDAIGHYGPRIFADNFKTYVWLPQYSQVDGMLPLEELPPVKGREKQPWAVARFHLDVSKGGKIGLALAEGKGLHVFVGEEEIKLAGRGGPEVVEIEVGAGLREVTLAATRGGALEGFQVELLDVEGSAAQARPLTLAERAGMKH